MCERFDCARIVGPNADFRTTALPKEQEAAGFATREPNYTSAVREQIR